jgi:hypothetical protein
MGIYECRGARGDLVELEELGTKRRGTFLCTSGYEGREDELWYVRALPPPFERFDYGVVMTTPYLLTGHTKREWLDLIERNAGSPAVPAFEAGLHEFMKYGPDLRYWNEFVFEAYTNHLSSVIALRGLPDVPGTRPNAPDYGR